MAGSRKPPSIRMLWGLAKSPELQLSDEDLYALVSRETGKESLRKLSQSELGAMVRILQNMKDGVRRQNGGKRTDEGGVPETAAQRRKIYTLCAELGWNRDERRVNGMAKRMFGVERLEWLTPAQCAALIEALKSMAARQRREGIYAGRENQ